MTELRWLRWLRCQAPCARDLYSITTHARGNELAGRAGFGICAGTLSAQRQLSQLSAPACIQCSGAGREAPCVQVCIMTYTGLRTNLVYQCRILNDRRSWWTNSEHVLTGRFGIRAGTLRAQTQLSQLSSQSRFSTLQSRREAPCVHVCIMTPTGPRTNRDLSADQLGIRPRGSQFWYTFRQVDSASALGLAAPTQQLLRRLSNLSMLY